MAQWMSPSLPSNPTAKAAELHDSAESILRTSSRRFDLWREELGFLLAAAVSCTPTREERIACLKHVGLIEEAFEPEVERFTGAFGQQTPAGVAPERLHSAFHRIEEIGNLLVQVRVTVTALQQNAKPDFLAEQRARQR